MRRVRSGKRSTVLCLVPHSQRLTRRGAARRGQVAGAFVARRAFEVRVRCVCIICIHIICLRLCHCVRFASSSSSAARADCRVRRTRRRTEYLWGPRDDAICLMRSTQIASTARLDSTRQLAPRSTQVESSRSRLAEVEPSRVELSRAEASREREPLVARPQRAARAPLDYYKYVFACSHLFCLRPHCGSVARAPPSPARCVDASLMYRSTAGYSKIRNYSRAIAS